MINNWFDFDISALFVGHQANITHIIEKKKVKGISGKRTRVKGTMNFDLISQKMFD